MTKIYTVIEEKDDGSDIIGVYTDAVKACDLALFLQEYGINNIVVEVQNADSLPSIDILRKKIRSRRNKASYIVEWNLHEIDYENVVG